MSTTTEELKKLYKKLGGSENTTRAASTPAEVLNGINELDFGFDTDGDLKLAGENSDIILTDDENTWDGTNKSLKDALAAASVDHIEFNPDEPATEDLEKLKGNGVVYGIPKFAISKEAEGNPITFADGADSPLVECEVEFEAQQDLHGYDKPWVGGAGKNKFGGEYGTTNKYPLPSGGTITASAKSDGAYKLTLRFYDSTDTKVGSDYAVVDVGSTSGTVSPSVPSGAEKFILFISSGGQASNFSEVQVESGSSPTSYEPYSNICPISGYSEVEIDGYGKNLFDKSNNTHKYLDGSIRLITNSEFLSVIIPIKAGEQYHYKQTVVGAYHRYAICDLLEENATFYVPTTPSTSGYIELTDFGFTNTTNKKYFVATIYRSTSDTYTFDEIANSCQLEHGLVATSFEPYNPDSKNYTISLGSTRYGGTLDVVRGVLRVTKEIITFDGTNVVFDGKLSASNTYYHIDNLLPVGDLDVNSTLSTANATRLGYVNSSHGVYNSSTLTRLNGDYFVYRSATSITIRISLGESISDLTSANAWLLAQYNAGTPLQIIKPLATPLTVQLTPTEIKSLLGNNTIFTDGKTLSIEYITKGASAIIKLIKALMPKANPAGDATDTLNKLEVDGTVYSIPSGGGGGNTVLAQSLNTLTVTEV